MLSSSKNVTSASRNNFVDNSSWSLISALS